MQRLFLGLAVVFQGCLVILTNLYAEDATDHVNRGNAWCGKGKYDKALSEYNKALVISPKDADTYLARGIAWAKKGDYDNAIADFNQALAINPRNAITHYNRGYVWD